MYTIFWSAWREARIIFLLLAAGGRIPEALFLLLGLSVAVVRWQGDPASAVAKSCGLRRHDGVPAKTRQERAFTAAPPLVFAQGFPSRRPELHQVPWRRPDLLRKVQPVLQRRWQWVELHSNGRDVLRWYGVHQADDVLLPTDHGPILSQREVPRPLLPAVDCMLFEGWARWLLPSPRGGV